MMRSSLGRRIAVRKPGRERPATARTTSRPSFTSFACGSLKPIALSPHSWGVNITRRGPPEEMVSLRAAMNVIPHPRQVVAAAPPTVIFARRDALVVAHPRV